MNKAYLLITVIMSACILLLTACPQPTAQPDPAENPVFSSQDLYQMAGTTITITTDTAGATISYTTDGTNPASSSTAVSGTSETSTASLIITSDVSVKAVALLEGAPPSEIITAQYERIYMHDTFENGTMDNWTDNEDNNTPVSVDTTQGADGSLNSLLLDNTTEAGSSDNPYGAVLSNFPEGITPTYISFYMRYQNSPDAYFQQLVCISFYSITDPKDESKRVLRFHFYNHGDSNNDKIVEGPSSTDVATNVSPETWYHVEVKNMVFTNGVEPGYGDIYLDDTFITQIELGRIDKTSLDAIKSITIDNEVGSGSGHKTWIDELFIK